MPPQSMPGFFPHGCITGLPLHVLSVFALNTHREPMALVPAATPCTVRGGHDVSTEIFHLFEADLRCGAFGSNIAPWKLFGTMTTLSPSEKLRSWLLVTEYAYYGKYILPS